MWIMAVGIKRIGVFASYGLDHSALEKDLKSIGYKMVNFHEGKCAYFVTDFSGNPNLPSQILSRGNCSFGDISNVAKSIDQGFQYVLKQCERSRECMEKNNQEAIKKLDEAILSGNVVF